MLYNNNNNKISKPNTEPNLSLFDVVMSCY